MIAGVKDNIAISIHAPREGSDCWTCRVSSMKRHFYPRSPRGERLSGKAHTSSVNAFLSTLPARGATGGQSVQDGFSMISIHAPREGSDITTGLTVGTSVIFLSTLPARGATPPTRHRLSAGRISIHAPREGSDLAR